LRDAVVVGLSGQRAHLVGDQRFRSEALDDARDVERTDVDDVRRLAARSRHFGEPVRREVDGGGGRSTLRRDLQRVDQVVVDAGLLIAQ